MTQTVPFLLTLLLILAACGPSAAPPASEPTAPAAASPTAAPAAEEPAASEADVPTGSQTYVIDPERSSASYAVSEEFFGLALSKYGIPAGLGETVGTSTAVSGQFSLNWDDLSNPLGENTFTVDLSQLESDQSLRDGWIRDNGPQFGTYPNATFVAESIEGGPDAYTPGQEVTFQMVGSLTVRDVTQPVTFDVTATYANGEINGTATAPLSMSAFGIEPPSFANTLTVADDFEVRLQFVAVAE
jgi:polyisoprenoid-binding protein YceI